MNEPREYVPLSSVNLASKSIGNNQLSILLQVYKNSESSNTPLLSLSRETESILYLHFKLPNICTRAEIRCVCFLWNMFSLSHVLLHVVLHFFNMFYYIIFNNPSYPQLVKISYLSFPTGHPNGRFLATRTHQEFLLKSEPQKWWKSWSFPVG